MTRALVLLVEVDRELLPRLLRDAVDVALMTAGRDTASS